MGKQTRKTYVCDRCGADAGTMFSDEIKGWARLRYRHEFNDRQKSQRIDLCTKCRDQFAAWVGEGALGENN